MELQHWSRAGTNGRGCTGKPDYQYKFKYFILEKMVDEAETWAEHDVLYTISFTIRNALEASRNLKKSSVSPCASSLDIKPLVIRSFANLGLAPFCCRSIRLVEAELVQKMYHIQNFEIPVGANDFYLVYLIFMRRN